MLKVLAPMARIMFEVLATMFKVMATMTQQNDAWQVPCSRCRQAKSLPGAAIPQGEQRSLGVVQVPLPTKNAGSKKGPTFDLDPWMERGASDAHAY